MEGKRKGKTMRELEVPVNFSEGEASRPNTA